MKILTKNERVFPNLTELDLENNNIGEKGIEHLTRNEKVFPNLTILYLENNSIN